MADERTVVPRKRKKGNSPDNSVIKTKNQSKSYDNSLDVEDLILPRNFNLVKDSDNLFIKSKHNLLKQYLNKKHIKKKKNFDDDCQLESLDSRDLSTSKEKSYYKANPKKHMLPSISTFSSKNIEVTNKVSNKEKLPKELAKQIFKKPTMTILESLMNDRLSQNKSSKISTDGDADIYTYYSKDFKYTINRYTGQVSCKSLHEKSKSSIISKTNKRKTNENFSYSKKLLIADTKVYQSINSAKRKISMEPLKKKGCLVLRHLKNSGNDKKFGHFIISTKFGSFVMKNVKKDKERVPTSTPFSNGVDNCEIDYISSLLSCLPAQFSYNGSIVSILENTVSYIQELEEQLKAQLKDYENQEEDIVADGIVENVAEFCEVLTETQQDFDTDISSIKSDQPIDVFSCSKNADKALKKNMIAEINLCCDHQVIDFLDNPFLSTNKFLRSDKKNEKENFINNNTKQIECFSELFSKIEANDEVDSISLETLNNEPPTIRREMLSRDVVFVYDSYNDPNNIETTVDLNNNEALHLHKFLNIQLKNIDRFDAILAENQNRNSDTLLESKIINAETDNYDSMVVEHHRQNLKSLSDHRILEAENQPNDCEIVYDSQMDEICAFQIYSIGDEGYLSQETTNVMTEDEISNMQPSSEEKVLPLLTSDNEITNERNTYAESLRNKRLFPKHDYIDDNDDFNVTTTYEEDEWICLENELQKNNEDTSPSIENESALIYSDVNLNSFCKIITPSKTLKLNHEHGNCSLEQNLFTELSP